METIYKLQPNRTMHLQGVSAYGAGAALWGTSENGFTVSGVFRDAADFAVLVLWDRDDFYGHPRWSYLPDGNFTGLVLDFDIAFQGIQAFESKKAPWTDWPYLDCQLTNGQRPQKKLIELATGPSGRSGASGTVTLNAGTIQSYDRVTLWYQNLAFDYIVAGRPKCYAESNLPGTSRANQFYELDRQRAGSLIGNRFRKSDCDHGRARRRRQHGHAV